MKIPVARTPRIPLAPHEVDVSTRHRSTSAHGSCPGGAVLVVPAQRQPEDAWRSRRPAPAPAHHLATSPPKHLGALVGIVVAALLVASLVLLLAHLGGRA